MNTQPLVQIMNACVNGRVRFKVTGLYRCESLKRHLELRLSTSDGINEVSSSILTGTVLVAYNSNQSTHAIALRIETFISEYKKNNGTITDASISDSISVYEEKRQKSQDKLKNRRTLRTLVSHAKDQLIRSWHILTGDSIVKELQSSQAQGLSAEEAYIRYKKYGPNLLPESVPRSGLSIFIDQFMSLPVGLLSGAAVLSALTGGVADAIAIMSVVTINAIIGYVTESQSEKTIHSLKSVVRPSALVLRNGQVQEVKSEDVVIGDIETLEKIPLTCQSSQRLG
jgi:Ca2+-transporting ATPase